MRCLVTAGPTREPIDQVRDWGNIFTGGTGFRIAKALADVAQVDLLTSNSAHLDEFRQLKRAGGDMFIGHADLKEKLTQRMRELHYDAVFMTAAISDYAPAGVFEIVARNGDQWSVRNIQSAKIKSTYPHIAILGERTEKLVDLFRSQWNFTGLLVKFKLEVGISHEDLLKVGRASRLSSGADYLVANTLDMISGENAGAYLIKDDGEQWIARDDLPAHMVRLVDGL